MRTITRASQPGGDGYVTPRTADWQLRDALRLDVHGLSEAGSVRPSNEDAFLIADITPDASDLHPPGVALPFFGVADGVGGHPGGGRASRLVIRRLVHEAVTRARRRDWAPERSTAAIEHSLEAVVHACQLAVMQCGTRQKELARMATTLSIGLLRERSLHVAHVGDSRCYLYRHDTLVQVTADHTVARAMAQAGVDLPATSALHHVLANALAANRESVEVETHSVTVGAGDAFLLCTDGLPRVVSDEEILAVLTRERSAKTASRQLVHRALEAGAPDNVTVIVGCLRDGRR
jgi:PPM family protein phosphatase